MTINSILHDLGNIRLPFKSHKAFRVAVFSTLLAYLTAIFLAGWVTIHFVVKYW